MNYLSRECLEDEFMELRPWDHNGNYPFCTLCQKWSGNDHITGKEHQKKLSAGGGRLGRA